MHCLHVLKSSFDIIVITETWADQTNSTSDYNIQGYNVFNTVKINKSGGCVALYIKDIFVSKLIINKSFVLDNMLECVTVALKTLKTE